MVSAHMLDERRFLVDEGVAAMSPSMELADPLQNHSRRIGNKHKP